jgi:hypothetical protein
MTMIARRSIFVGGGRGLGYGSGTVGRGGIAFSDSAISAASGSGGTSG